MVMSDTELKLDSLKVLRKNEMAAAGNENSCAAYIELLCEPNSHPFYKRKICMQPNVEVKVGRSIARNKVNENNAIFDCKVLSRNHAIFWYSDNKFYIKDTKSSNGTFINDKKIVQSEFEELYSGDIVKFGVDVIENSRKEVHGCIIACVKLYNSEGMEIFPTDVCNKENSYDSDIYKIRGLLQETTHRESYLKLKLYDIQNIMDLTRTNSLNCWQAMIDEDRLLNKIDVLENKLQYLLKHFSENRLKIDILKLYDEKLLYQNSAKEVLRRVYQDRITAMNKLLEVERKYSKSENNCCILREKNNESQRHLQELNTRFYTLETDCTLYKTKLEATLQQIETLENCVNMKNALLYSNNRSGEETDIRENSKNDDEQKDLLINYEEIFKSGNKVNSITTNELSISKIHFKLNNLIEQIQSYFVTEEKGITINNSDYVLHFENHKLNLLNFSNDLKQIIEQFLKMIVVCDEKTCKIKILEICKKDQEHVYGQFCLYRTENEILSQKLSEVEDKLKKMENEKKFVNFFLQKSHINQHKLEQIQEQNYENDFNKNLFLISSVKEEEELILYKTKYNKLLKENIKLKSKILEISNPKSFFFFVNKISLVGTIIISIIAFIVFITK